MNGRQVTRSIKRIKRQRVEDAVKKESRNNNVLPILSRAFHKKVVYVEER